MSDNSSYLVKQYIRCFESINKCLLESLIDETEWLNILRILSDLRDNISKHKCKPTCLLGKKDKLCNIPAEGFNKIFKLLEAKRIVDLYSNLQINTALGPVTFKTLSSQVPLLVSTTATQELKTNWDPSSSELKPLQLKPAKRSERKGCRCKSSNETTCRSQRCQCYSSKSGCKKCKCIGCKNSFPI